MPRKLQSRSRPWGCPRRLLTSGVVSLGAGSAVMAAGPEQRRINVHSRGGGGNSAETTGLQASWMHYSSAHHQWRPRGGPSAAEKELPPPPFPSLWASPWPSPSPTSQSSPSTCNGGLTGRISSVQFPKVSELSPKSIQSQPPNTTWLKPKLIHSIDEHFLCTYCMPSTHKHF